MATQIAHESEVHRQHVRLRIPILAEIDGTRFTVDDWSMGGFGVQSPITSRQAGERFPVRLIFPFEDFELALRVDAQIVYVVDEPPRFGCKFLSLTHGQAALFRYLVNAYLAGEIVSAGDVLDVAGREEGAGGPAHVLELDPEAEEVTIGRRVRRVLGLALTAAVAAGLAGLLWLGVKERFLTVRALSAVIEAPTFAVRAPLDGLVEPDDDEGILEPGQAFGAVRDLEGRTAALTSPCTCVVRQWRLPAGQYAEAGEVVAMLVSAEAPLVVHAQVPFESAFRLASGDPAIIEVPGEAEPMRGQIEAIDAKAPAFAGPGEAGTARAGRVEVIVRPDRPFDFDRLGSLVDVRFP